jgi:hypothetical protein
MCCNGTDDDNVKETRHDVRGEAVHNLRSRIR